VLVDDDFGGTVRAGKVIGSAIAGGMARRGADREGIIRIRDGAMRIPPLFMPGWGRAGVSYGPIERENGLGLAIHVLNSDNGSETYRLASVFRRVGRWALASETDSLWTRLLRWPFRLSGDGLLRKLFYWYSACHIEAAYRPLRENLAVGWFTADVPGDPTKSSEAFVVQGAGKMNGILNVCIGETLMPVIKSLPNVPMYYFVLLREQGSAYYIASHDHLPVTGAFPKLRPLAISTATGGKLLFPGLHPSMVGESGFTAETILYGSHVARYAALGTWYGTAHAADRLTGDGSLGGSRSETSSEWQALAGTVEKTADGARGGGEFAMAGLFPDAPSGLIHAIVALPDNGARAGLAWRIADSGTYLCLSISRNGCDLGFVTDDERQDLQSCALPASDGSEPIAVQIRDDGREIGVSLDGHVVIECAPPAMPHAAADGVGVVFDTPGGESARVWDFEAHPRSIELPMDLPFAAPWSESGTVPVIAESFAGESGPLEGYESSDGHTWSNIMGQCPFRVSGNGGVDVVATAEKPAANRTAYGIDWPDPVFADLTAVIVPPGQGRGQNHSPRGGLLFWQDAKNYFIVNNWLDDSYGGGSISAFFYFRGFEDIYDAVWTNVNDRLAHGEPNRLRVVCDGHRFRVYLNGETVLYRAFRDIYPKFDRLRINKVGLIANWEWGLDTGSRFLSFEGLAGPDRSHA